MVQYPIVRVLNLKLTVTVIFVTRKISNELIELQVRITSFRSAYRPLSNHLNLCLNAFKFIYNTADFFKPPYDIVVL